MLSHCQVLRVPPSNPLCWQLSYTGELSSDAQAAPVKG